MKYTITRQFSFTSEKFDIINDSRLIANVKITPSKRYKHQYHLNLMDKSSGEYSCIVETHENELHHYLIYSINNQTDEKNLFAHLIYEVLPLDNAYTIIIGQKLYKVRSSDLKYRRLTIVDEIHSNSNYPETLFQLIDTFSKSNDKYHVNIHDKEWPLGYCAITILLHLHESQ